MGCRRRSEEIVGVASGMIERWQEVCGVSGPVKTGRLTKRVIAELTRGSIAVICHKDLDETAAEGLLEAGARAVINAAPTISGNYPAKGALVLLEAGVPLCEIAPTDFSAFRDGEEAVIGTKFVHAAGRCIPYRPLTFEDGLRQYTESNRELSARLSAFIDNTLDYAQAEKEFYLRPLDCPPLRTELAGRPALVVVRGRRYRQDLLALLGYIAECRPVLIGVDGGADALLQYGLVPDLIVGDMDSVSDRALFCGAELVAHAYYPGGRSPGLKRVRALGLEAAVVRLPGTSEDLALLLAYERKAELIVAVGAHTDMIDFLGKGRKGMASTMLVRMKVGDRLIDAKGVSLLISGAGRGRGDAACDFRHYAGLE